jgi:hypothetical protein
MLARNAEEQASTAISTIRVISLDPGGASAAQTATAVSRFQICTGSGRAKWMCRISRQVSLQAGVGVWGDAGQTASLKESIENWVV